MVPCVLRFGTRAEEVKWLGRDFEEDEVDGILYSAKYELQDRSISRNAIFFIANPEDLDGGLEKDLTSVGEALLLGNHSWFLWHSLLDDQHFSKISGQPLEVTPLSRLYFQGLGWKAWSCSMASAPRRLLVSLAQTRGRDWKAATWERCWADQRRVQSEAAHRRTGGCLVFFRCVWFSASC